MVVHAHPDDESLGSGGTVQHYGRLGVRTVVVICTGGEVGEISDPALATPETLGDVRRQEAKVGWGNPSPARGLAAGSAAILPSGRPGAKVYRGT